MNVKFLLRRLSEKNNTANVATYRGRDASRDAPKELGRTLHTTQLMEHLQVRVNSVLPWNLMNRVQVSLDKERRLVLLAPDSVTLTQARMMMPALQRLFRDIQSEISRHPRWRTLGICTDRDIRLKVAPVNPPKARRTHTPPPIPEHTSEALKELAETCGDESLSLVLNKLARHIQ